MIKQKKITIGWREWGCLPELKIPAIKLKIDTGAKTSAIHAFNIKKHSHDGCDYVHFFVYPIQGNKKISCKCRAKVVDERYVMSSNGHKERRYVIETILNIGYEQWKIEVTLSDRDPLKFRMLLGRDAMRSRVIIDPNSSFKQGNVPEALLERIYKKKSKYRQV